MTTTSKDEAFEMERGIFTIKLKSDGSVVLYAVTNPLGVMLAFSHASFIDLRSIINEASTALADQAMKDKP
jgi:hypothetical protein